MKKTISEYIKRIINSFVCGVTVSSMCSCNLFFANAASSSKGAKKYTTINNVSFTMQNSIFTGKEGSEKYARAATSVDASQNLGGGFMGAKPMLYYDTGAIASSGSWYYSSSGTSGISAVTSKTGFSGTPSFYSHGFVEIWDGYDYQQFRPYRTPYLNDYT